MEKKFDNKVAIVTASAGAGIGQAVARAFAKEGATVVISDLNPKRTESVAEDIASTYGVKALPFVCDVGVSAQVEAMVEKTMSEYGRVDILVNNAGLVLDVKPTWETSDETWRKLLDVNLSSAFYTCRAVIPHMIRQRWGRIVNMSSPGAWWGSTVEGPVYPAAKAGVIALSRVLSTEVGPAGITVNVVAPAGIYNEFYGRDPKAREHWFTEIKNSLVVPRLGRPDDVANLILFLASEEAEFITGEVLCVTGGRGRGESKHASLFAGRDSA